MCTVSQLIVASALVRQESRGSHYRSDFPESGDDASVHNIYLQWDGERLRQWTEPVVFSRLQPPPLAAKTAEETYLAQEGE
jgi:succinate dehydrogenase/fumarate reductase flavoprotein subunit